MENEAKRPSFGYALTILIMVIAIIATGMLVFGASIQMMMLQAQSLCRAELVLV